MYFFRPLQPPLSRNSILIAFNSKRHKNLELVNGLNWSDTVNILLTARTVVEYCMSILIL
jgi:hypothetical protein